jgi:hypothetical protein
MKEEWKLKPWWRKQRRTGSCRCNNCYFRSWSGGERRRWSGPPGGRKGCRPPIPGTRCTSHSYRLWFPLCFSFSLCLDSLSFTLLFVWWNRISNIRALRKTVNDVFLNLRDISVVNRKKPKEEKPSKWSFLESSRYWCRKP